MKFFILLVVVGGVLGATVEKPLQHKASCMQCSVQKSNTTTLLNRFIGNNHFSFLYISWLILGVSAIILNFIMVGFLIYNKVTRKELPQCEEDLETVAIIHEYDTTADEN